MDFLSVLPSEVPKSTYQCTAVITIGGSAGRRGSGGSDGEAPLGRIMSGGRRKSMQGGVTKQAADGSNEGTWYWRCRAGVTGENLVIMPISNPPNPLLTQHPPPLSNAFTTNGAKAAHGNAHNAHNAGHDEGLGAKFMGGIRRASAAFIHKPDAHTAHQSQQPITEGAQPDGTNAAHDTAPVAENKVTQDTTHVPEEHSWPGVVEGRPLSGIIVPLHYLQGEKVHMGGTDKTGCFVSVQVGSAIAGKSGHLRFEFDKDWIGAKAEAELLHHNLQMGVQNATPLFTNVQLGRDGHKNVGHDKQYEDNWQNNMRGKW